MTIVEWCDPEEETVIHGPVFRAGAMIRSDELEESARRFGTPVVVEYGGRAGKDHPPRHNWILWRRTPQAWQELARTVALATEWQASFAPILEQLMVPDQVEVRDAAERVMTELARELDGLTPPRRREVINCLHSLIAGRAARLRHVENISCLEPPVLPRPARHEAA